MSVAKEQLEADVLFGRQQWLEDIFFEEMDSVNRMLGVDRKIPRPPYLMDQRSVAMNLRGHAMMIEDKNFMPYTPSRGKQATGMTEMKGNKKLGSLE